MFSSFSAGNGNIVQCSTVDNHTVAGLLGSPVQVCDGSFFPQLKPGSAHLCVYHGISHNPLPAARLRATIPTHDSQIHGDRNPAVWHVHR